MSAASRPHQIRPLSAALEYVKTQVVPNLYFLTVGYPSGAFISVDVTDQCNLRCQHCYFFEQEQEGVLDAAAWEQRVLELKQRHPFLSSCTWVGGEPLLRRDIIERCKVHFRHNLVVTNGTIPLPDWPEVMFHVSIDGDQVQHDSLRRQPGLYELMKRNVGHRPELNVTGAMCITARNIDTVETVLQDWSTSTDLKGMLFSFYTPIQGLDDGLWMGWDRRDAVIDRILQLKRTRYRDFIAMPDRMLELMKSDHSRQVTDTCIFASKGYSLTTRGEVKEKCMLGPKSDCDRCGCVVPYYLHYRQEPRTVAKLLWEGLRN